MFQIKFKVLHEDAKIPGYSTPGSAGADLVSVEEKAIKPGHVAMVSTGLAMEIPEGYEVQVRPRSGLAGKQYVTVINSPGTIDSDYRGEVKVLLHNVGEYIYQVKPGDRIAQMVVAKVEQPAFIVVEELSDTVRGEGGFGHTGVEGESEKCDADKDLDSIKLRGDMYEAIAVYATFLSSHGLVVSGDELVDFLNRNGIKKKNGGTYRKGRGIYGTIKHTYDVCVEVGRQDLADNVASVFKTKSGGNPWE